MTKEYKPEGFVMTITGPSGSGKSTLESRLEKQGFSRIISTTTRLPRPGEKDGVNYHFVSEAEFHSMVNRGMMAESVEFHGNYYGIQIDHLREVMEEGKPVVIVVEPEGLKQIRETCATNNWSHHAVFVTGPTAMLADRIMRREMAEGGDVQRGVNRIKNLLQKEANWQQEVDYDTLIYEFGPDTESFVVADLVGLFNYWLRYWGFLGKMDPMSVALG